MPASLHRALRLAHETLREMPEAPEFLDTLGYVYLRKGQNRRASRQFSLAIRAARAGDFVARAHYHYHLGLAWERLGRERLAARSFQYALALDPDFADAAQARARLAEATR